MQSSGLFSCTRVACVFLRVVWFHSCLGQLNEIKLSNRSVKSFVSVKKHQKKSRWKQIQCLIIISRAKELLQCKLNCRFIIVVNYMSWFYSDLFAWSGMKRKRFVWNTSCRSNPSIREFFGRCALCLLATLWEAYSTGIYTLRMCQWLWEFRKFKSSFQPDVNKHIRLVKALKDVLFKYNRNSNGF